MRFRLGLRYRVAFAFAIFGGLVSLLLASGLYLAIRDLERRLVDEALAAELQDYVARRQRNPYSLPPRAAGHQGYVLPAAAGERQDVPVELIVLAPGKHHVELGGTRYRALVEDKDGTRFFMLYDESRLARRERRFLFILGAGVLVMVALSAGGAFWFAGRVIAPVTNLVRRVQNLEPEGSPSKLGGNFPDDEVGDLARAFDRYLERLAAFIERERAFTGDVSHELRTPLAVLRGAVEVSLADGSLGEPQRLRLQRIQRATDEMCGLTSALLVLAREEELPQSAASCDVGGALKELIEKNRFLIEKKPVSVAYEQSEALALDVDRAVLDIVLGNLLRNAFVFTEAGTITVRIEKGSVVVEDTGIGIRDEELGLIFERYYRGQDSRGSGIGLSLVKRICERYGWRIQVRSRQGEGTSISLSFGLNPSS